MEGDDYPEEEIENYQIQREEKLLKKKREIPQHGKSIGKIYKDAVIKRLKKKD